MIFTSRQRSKFLDFINMNIRREVSLTLQKQDPLFGKCLLSCQYSPVLPLLLPAPGQSRGRGSVLLLSTLYIGQQSVSLLGWLSHYSLYSTFRISADIYWPYSTGRGICWLSPVEVWPSFEWLAGWLQRTLSTASLSTGSTLPWLLLSSISFKWPSSDLEKKLKKKYQHQTSSDRENLTVL